MSCIFYVFVNRKCLRVKLSKDLYQKIVMKKNPKHFGLISECSLPKIPKTFFLDSQSKKLSKYLTESP